MQNSKEIDEESEWGGWLTVDNIERVAARARKICADEFMVATYNHYYAPTEPQALKLRHTKLELPFRVLQQIEVDLRDPASLAFLLIHTQEGTLTVRTEVRDATPEADCVAQQTPHVHLIWDDELRLTYWSAAGEHQIVTVYRRLRKNRW